MNRTRCHRCGKRLGDGELRYQVAVHVRSDFDEILPDADPIDESSVERLVNEISSYGEEDLNRQVYEDDVFVMCPSCKEAFMENIYSHLHPQATPEHGRAHLIH
ncbi:MAG: hypothetical protein AB1733_15480 [Thermodesulfobacteriota bacterium]